MDHLFRSVDFFISISKSVFILNSLLFIMFFNSSKNFSISCFFEHILFDILSPEFIINYQLIVVKKLNKNIKNK